MKRVIFALLAVLAICSTTLAKYSGGSGTSGDPYQIADVNDLLTLANNANDYNKCFIITADINLSGYTFTTAVIAPDTSISSSGFQGTAFTGRFDGNGFKIMNLTINTAGAGNDYLGLFGYIASPAVIKNLGIQNAVITGGAGSYYLGGLCGMNYYGTINNCRAVSRVSGGDSSYYLSGLCGYNRSGTISNCYATGYITGGDSSCDLGCLCGLNYYGSICNCYATGDITGDIYVILYDLGGLCGYNQSGTISSCYSTSYIEGGFLTFAFYLGGLCGRNDYGTIENSYATGQVTGWDTEYIGGLCGYNYYGTINNCYAAGPVDGYVYKGGFCGRNLGAFSGCFWDTQTSGMTDGVGNMDPDPNSVQGKTTVEMKTQSTFTDAGWDFVWETVNGPNDVWAICEGVSYPKLAWQYVIGDSDIDLDVDFTDFAFMGQHWMQPDSTLYCGGTDLTGDEWVDLDDLDTLAENWLDAQ